MNASQLAAADGRAGLRALGLAALTLWFPTLLPLLFGPAAGDAMYVTTMWCLPGLFVVLLVDFGPLEYPVAGFITLLLLAALSWVLWRLPRAAARPAQVAVLMLVAAESFFWSVVVEGASC